MDFIFNINAATDTLDKQEEFEQILKEVEIHFQDWNNFYNLYQMFAPPPTDNTKQIQEWFKELQASFFKIINKYNETVNKFADIDEIQEKDIQDMLKGVMSKVSTQNKPKETKETDSDKMMWG